MTLNPKGILSKEPAKEGLAAISIFSEVDNSSIFLRVGPKTANDENPNPKAKILPHTALEQEPLIL